MSIKKKIGKLIPYGLIHSGRRVLHFGFETCEVCGAGSRSRIDTGYGFPVLEKLKVIGGMRRRADACPICHSSCRERLIWFYLTRHFFPSMGAGPRIAHFAPEKGLSLILKQRFGETWTAYDLAPTRYRHLTDVREANLENLPIADGTVDLFLCNHVMEHVYDLQRCLREVRRVLSTSGIAIMQVPIAHGLDKTRDGGQTMSPAERIEYFGQDDHVRLFTAEGYLSELRQAGFDVSSFRAFDEDSDVATRWALDPFEELLLIRRTD